MEGELVPILIGLAMIVGAFAVGIFVAAPNDHGDKKE